MPVKIWVKTKKKKKKVAEATRVAEVTRVVEVIQVAEADKKAALAKKEAELEQEKKTSGKLLEQLHKNGPGPSFLRKGSGKPEGSAVNIEIDMNSLVIEPAKLAGHLKTADFFDVEKFPKTTFASTGVSPGGAGGATHTVTGNLTLHGVTKAISFPATIAVTQLGVDATADFVINRKDFGVVYPGMPDDLIKDDVVIKLSLKAPRKG